MSNISDAAANAAADGVTTLLNNGFIRVYNGTQPANANTAVTTQTLLATLQFGATAFLPALFGVATANAITMESNTVAGTASWFRALKSDGTTAVYDGSVGTSGTDMIVTTTTIGSGGDFTATSATYTQPEHI